MVRNRHTMSAVSPLLDDGASSIRSEVEPSLSLHTLDAVTAFDGLTSQVQGSESFVCLRVAVTALALTRFIGRDSQQAQRPP
jgi:hypothetical protein